MPIKDSPGQEGPDSAPGAEGGKKRFLLRLDPQVHAALEKWAADDLRSLNSQIEFLLKDALKKAGRMK